MTGRGRPSSLRTLPACGTRNVLRYDPDHGWSETGKLLAGRGGAAIALLDDGRVLLAGGYAGDPGKGKAVKTAELFDPRTGSSAKAAARSRQTGEDGLPIAAMTPADGAAAEVLVAM